MRVYLFGVARHVATILGGYLGSSQDDITALAGALVAVAGVVWSMVDKWIASKA